MQQETHFQRVVGGDTEQKQRALRDLQRSFEAAGETMPCEIEKSEKDIRIIQKVEAAVDELVTKNGGKAKPIPMENIHLVHPGEIQELTPEHFERGVAGLTGLFALVERPASDLDFASTLTHELLHLKSYKAARVGDPDQKPGLYRQGIQTIRETHLKDGGKEIIQFFADIEEAIVSECTWLILNLLKEDELFRDEASASHEIKELARAHYLQTYGFERAHEIDAALENIVCIPDAQKYLSTIHAHQAHGENREAMAADIIDKLMQTRQMTAQERQEERLALYQLIDEMVERTENTISKADIFLTFVQANFSGHYLPLARMIEHVFGKGSFKALGKKFASIKIKKGTS